MYLNMSMNTNDPVLILAKALADENRYKLLRYIAERQEASCAELNECVHLSQPTISHHLKILLEAGLLSVRREGQRAYFTFNRTQFEGCLDRCAEISELGKEPTRVRKR